MLPMESKAQTADSTALKNTPAVVFQSLDTIAKTKTADSILKVKTRLHERLSKLFPKPESKPVEKKVITKKTENDSIAVAKKEKIAEEKKAAVKKAESAKPKTVVVRTTEIEAELAKMKAELAEMKKQKDSVKLPETKAPKPANLAKPKQNKLPKEFWWVPSYPIAWSISYGMGGDWTGQGKPTKSVCTLGNHFELSWKIKGVFSLNGGFSAIRYGVFVDSTKQRNQIGFTAPFFGLGLHIPSKTSEVFAGTGASVHGVGLLLDHRMFQSNDNLVEFDNGLEYGVRLQVNLIGFNNKYSLGLFGNASYLQLFKDFQLVHTVPMTNITAGVVVNIHKKPTPKHNYHYVREKKEKKEVIYVQPKLPCTTCH